MYNPLQLTSLLADLLKKKSHNHQCNHTTTEVHWYHKNEAFVIIKTYRTCFQIVSVILME